MPVGIPLYSPDFNSIENVFSILKAKVSSFRPVFSSRETLKLPIEQAIEQFNSSEPKFFLNLI